MKVTVPNGLVGLVLVSVTVTVHVEAWFTITGLSQLTMVEVKPMVKPTFTMLLLLLQ